jgi:putative MFS transporter
MQPATVPSDGARDRPSSGGISEQRAAGITARIDRLPASRSMWSLLLLVSLAGLFEVYDLYQTAYVPPGLVRDGIFSAATTKGFFGLSDQATFAAATFLGLFFGAIAFSSVADRFGRRFIFIQALLWYSAATFVMALQTTAIGVIVFRFLAGVGLGVELVTGDAYLAELMPKHMRGRAFAISHFVAYLAIPLLAFLAWRLIPESPLGVAGWRYVVLIGSSGALFIWWVRKRLPESPRWLAQHGRIEEAERVVRALEARAEADLGGPLPPPGPAVAEESHRASLREIWKPPYAKRTAMLVVFNFFQSIGVFGFMNWLPTLLEAGGHSFTKSLLYSFCIACAAPFMALFWSVTVAERFERKWLIVAAAAAIAILGPLFAAVSEPALLVTLGVLITGCNTLLSIAFHVYQAELYPTRIRARAVGFVYSFSRLSTAVTSFLIAFCLQRWGAPGVFACISFAMLMVIGSIAFFGPRTLGRSLEEVSR